MQWVLLGVIVAILLAWYFWQKYGALYTAIQDNPNAIKAGISINRYATDIQGLIGAYETAESTDGNFMSRLGAFFGALPS